MTTLKHYDPVDYYEHLVDLLAFASSPAMLRRRLRSTGNRTVRWVHRIRTAGMRNNLTNYRGILSMLREDRGSGPSTRAGPARCPSSTGTGTNGCSGGTPACCRRPTGCPTSTRSSAAGAAVRVATSWSHRRGTTSSPSSSNASPAPTPSASAPAPAAPREERPR